MSWLVLPSSLPSHKIEIEVFIMPPTNQSKRWVFTLNNPSAAEKVVLYDSFNSHEDVEYVVVGNEVAASGTPHLQGFIIFKTPKRFNAVRLFVGHRAHVESARGTNEQAATYCKKDADFWEAGVFPVSQQGKRSDFERLKDYLQTIDHRPSEVELATEFTNLYGRYRAACLRFVDLFYQPVAREIGQPNGWQRELESRLDGDANDRSLIFVVDPPGAAGKSWFVRYFMSKHPGECQRLSVGKRDDLAHAFDPTVRVLFLDIPRTQLEFLQYSFLESVKDKLIFSPKYDSTCKFLEHNVHVVVFTNEEPDYNKLTGDRYDVFRPYADNETN